MQRTDRRLDQRTNARSRARVAPALERRMVREQKAGDIRRFVFEGREGHDEIDLGQRLGKTRRSWQREHRVRTVDQETVDAPGLHLVDEAKHVLQTRGARRRAGGVLHRGPDRTDDRVEQQDRRGSRRRTNEARSIPAAVIAAFVSPRASADSKPLTRFFAATALASARARMPSLPAAAGIQ